MDTNSTPNSSTTSNSATSDPNSSAEHADSSTQPNSPNDASTAIEALRKERERSEKLAKEAKSSAAKAAELESNLSKYKDIDPEKYAQALDRIAKDEENQLVAQKRWEELRAKSQKREGELIGENTNMKSQLERMKLQTEISKAFRKAGGIEFADSDPGSVGIEAIVPEDLITNFLAPRLKMEDGKITVLDQITGVPEINADGTFKSLDDKMLELRKSSLSNMFNAGNVPSGYNSSAGTTVSSNGKNLVVYTKQQVREGNPLVDLQKIASGEAVVR
jgi:hypothetical protein